ncbi:MAG: ion transporter [Rhodospirillales bacterium]|nr:ion transporter [Rhodospirillales bacterium]
MINAILLGLETVPSVMTPWGWLIVGLDTVILAIFVFEIALRMIAHGKVFWRDPWSLFDTAVVAVALVPSGGSLSVLRALRILRVLRLISVVPRLRKVVETLMRSLPGMGSIALLLVMLFYVFAVMATKLFGQNFPEWFGSIGQSMYSLFQIMTLESWSMGIVRPVMAVHPMAWAFFVPFILVVSFAVLNLFIAVVVDSMQQVHQEEQDSLIKSAEEIAQRERAALHDDIRTLREEISHLRADLDRRDDRAARSSGSYRAGPARPPIRVPGSPEPDG